MSSLSSSRSSSPVPIVGAPAAFFTDRVSPLGMRRIDIVKTLFLIYGPRPKGADRIEAGSLVQDIIDLENVKRRKEAEEQKPPRDPELFSLIHHSESGEWNPGDHNGFAMRSYMVTSVGTSKIGRAHRKGGADIPEQRTNTFIMFLFRTLDSGGGEVYALTTRHSWRVVHPYTDFAWPLKFCRYLLHAGRLQNATSESVIGAARTTQVTYSEAYRVEHLEGRDCVYTKLCLPFHPSAPMLKLGPFLSPKGRMLKGDINVTVKVGQVKVQRDLALGDYPTLLNSAAEVMAEPLSSQRQQQFEVLDYLAPVEDRHIRKRLEDHIFDELSDSLAKGTALPYSLRHRYTEDFQNSDQEDLLVFHKGKKYPRPKRCTLSELLVFLRSIITEKDKVKALKSIELSFDKKKYLFIEFIEGEVRTSNGSYFLINKRYYRLSGDYIALVRTDFRRALPQLLMSKDSPGMLPLKWGGQKRHGHLIQKDLTQADKSVKLETLVGKKCAYLTKDKKLWRPQTQTLVGEILTCKVVLAHRKGVEKFLGRKKSVKQASLEKDLEVTTEVAKEIWTELTKERDVLIKEKDQYYVLNPLSGNKAVDRLLRRRSHEYYARETEGCYNERYLTHKDAIVGDRVCPFNIEIFDVIRSVGDTTYVYHVKEGFDLHARDALDQLMNSVELLYEARSAPEGENALNEWYRQATNPTGVDKEDQAYRERLKKRMQKMTLEEFKALFLERKLVFVYAVLDTHTQESSLAREAKLQERFSVKDFEGILKTGRKTSITAQAVFDELKKSGHLDEKGRLTATFYATSKKRFKELDGFGKVKALKERIYDILAAQKSQFDSTIALLTLRRAAKRMERYGFGFKICQIGRPNYEEGDTPVWTAPTDIDISAPPPTPATFEHLDLKFHKTHETKGDGACAIHALMENGFENGSGIFNVGDATAHPNAGERAKRDFLEKFMGALDVDNELALNCISELCISDKKMKALLDDAGEPSLQEVREKKKGFDPIYRAILNDDEDSSEVFKALKGSRNAYKRLSADALKELLKTDEKARLNAFSAVQNDIRDVLEAYEIYEESQQAVYDAQGGHELARRTFLKRADVRAWYQKQVLASSYHLSDRELELAAQLYNRKVILFSTSDGQAPQELNPNVDGEWVAIMHEGGYHKGHYTRLVAFEE